MGAVLLPENFWRVKWPVSAGASNGQFRQARPVNESQDGMNDGYFGQGGAKFIVVLLFAPVLFSGCGWTCFRQRSDNNGMDNSGTRRNLLEL